MNKREQILANHDKLLEAMLDKDEQILRGLIHPEASVFGSAIHEFEKGIENVINYYMNSLALVPDERSINITSRQYTDLEDHALIEQEFEIHFKLEDKPITLLTLRQTALWVRVPEEQSPEPKWVLKHDHASMPDHLGAFETISSNELLERNLDLEVEIEKLKNKLEDAYRDLSTTREQLLQKEKLASIGQLTAGIAHEIKNPLNFVSNFSDVSLELVNEMREELTQIINNGKSGKDPEHELILDILVDIESNLTKIHEHGKRANSIVKSMLLHSRGKSGKAVPTNLNNLIDEYVKLAYHGMRAADSSFNVDIKTEYDVQIPLMDLIPQDISRAFLNLINNAMYAANEHVKTNPDHKPMVQVSTKQKNGEVEIRIRDNGVGIPDDIREKIFQPFFTTKPSGEGTGLGLSMTYDIIKVHKGTLNIDSKVNEFTEFLITLPLNKQI